MWVKLVEWGKFSGASGRSGATGASGSSWASGSSGARGASGSSGASGARGKRPRTLNPPPNTDTLEGLSVVQLIWYAKDPGPFSGKGILNNPLLKRSYVGFRVEGLQVYSFPKLN